LNLFESVDVHPVGARELRELYKRATEAVSVTFAMPKRIALPKIPGVDQAFLGVLPASDVVAMLTDPSGGIAGIIAATNRQTAVSDEDLAAREQFHKDLEEYFAIQPEPQRLYYERRSRQYVDQREINKTRIITRSVLTRAYVSMFRDDPARAGRYQEMRDVHGEFLFRPNHHLRAYYAAATAWYRLEWLLRNGRIDRTYGPARYHLLGAIKTYVLGEGPLPLQPKQAEKACQKIVDVMWRQLPAEDLVRRLLAAIDVARQEEKIELSDMVRTQRFADRVRRAVLQMRSAAAS
jgi:hypothetical protein